ncbi:MAG: RNase adapter RapZ [Coprococcus sp.]
MRFVIVTGMSGAGKSSVLKMLEDAGYFCVDNLPVPLVLKFAEISWHEENNISKVALGIDIRGRDYLNMLEDVLRSIREEGYSYEILFMDCRDETLIKRYKETRRSHPLAGNGRIETAIAEEREKLRFLKEQSDYIIDSSTLLIRDLKKEIQHIFVEDKRYGNFYITLLSFGFKYGIPSDADLVFDVRFLPNPYYVEELKHQTGNDAPVYNYVMQSEDAGIFLKQLYDMLVFLIPRYITEGKNQLVVAIGCTGGKHRSVTMTNALYKRLESLEYSVKAEHRDIDRDVQRRNQQMR